jgi:hypothetical protein
VNPRQPEPLPGWPAALTTKRAAAYLEIGEGSLLTLTRRMGVKPLPLGLAVTRWRRADLDEMLDRLAERGESPQIVETPDIDPQAALERVRRRGRRL